MQAAQNYCQRNGRYNNNAMPINDSIKIAHWSLFEAALL